MKKTISTLLICFIATSLFSQTDSTKNLKEVVISGVRAQNNDPVSQSNINKESIHKNYSPSCQTCYYSDNGERPCNRHLNKLKPDYLKGVECALNNYIHYRPFENPNKIQMKRFKFYKEESDRWYVDLPDWTGTKEDLELVAGADTMLEYMSEGEKEIWLVLSEEKFENGDTLEFIRLATEFENGAFYLMKNYKGIEINLELWLCDVLNFVFKKFPKVLYLQKI